MDQPLTPLARRVVERVRVYERRRRRIHRLLLAAGMVVGVGAASWFAFFSAPDAGSSEQAMERPAAGMGEAGGREGAGDRMLPPAAVGTTLQAGATAPDAPEAPGTGAEDLARPGSGSAADIASGLRQPVEKELLPPGLARAARRYLESGESRDLGGFLVDLSNVEDPAVHRLLADVVRRAVFHPDESVRGYAWRNLSRSLPAEAAGPALDRLLRQVLDQGAVFDREHAIAFIADHGRRSLVPDIGRLLASDVAQVRKRAVVGLGRLGGPEAERLIESVLEDADPEMRLSAILALRDCGRPEANDLLYEATVRGPPGDRATALLELREAGDPRIREVAYSFLVAAASPRMLSTACDVLGKLRAPLSREQAEFLRQVDAPPLYRVAFGFALAAAGADPEAALLLSLIESEELAVRAAVVRTLAEFDRERFRDTILRLRDDPAPYVRDTVRQVLDANSRD